MTSLSLIWCRLTLGNASFRFSRSDANFVQVSGLAAQRPLPVMTKDSVENRVLFFTRGLLLPVLASRFHFASVRSALFLSLFAAALFLRATLCFSAQVSHRVCLGMDALEQSLHFAISLASLTCPRRVWRLCSFRSGVWFLTASYFRRSSAVCLVLGCLISVSLGRSACRGGSFFCVKPEVSAVASFRASGARVVFALGGLVLFPFDLALSFLLVRLGN